MTSNPQGFASLDDYLDHYAGAAEIPTPIVDRATGRVRTLSSLLRPPARECLLAKSRRMADLITKRVTFAGGITEDELLAGGFEPGEIKLLFRLALRRSGVVQLGANL